MMVYCIKSGVTYAKLLFLGSIHVSYFIGISNFAKKSVTSEDNRWLMHFKEEFHVTHTSEVRIPQKKKQEKSTGCRKRRKIETDDPLYARVFERETSEEEDDDVAAPSAPSNILIHASVDADGILEDSDCEEGDEYVAFISLGKAVLLER